MGKSSVQITQIEECLEVVYTAFCEGCGIDRSNNVHEGTFAKDLHYEGWRCNDDGELFCPDCAKKRELK